VAVVIDEETTFEEAYVDLFVRAERVAVRILGDRVHAEDVAAETMVRAMGSWSRIRTYRSPWVTRVATNLAIDVVRRRSVAHGGGPTPWADVDSTDRIILQAALAKLPDRQRQALVLRYVVGLSGAETAQSMGLSVLTVKTHLQRALAAMRRQFGDEFKEMTDAPR
jgi:RNA polymerase sigma-70 factor (ECF subfamily)